MILSGAFGLIGGRNTVANWQINVPMTVDARSFSNTRGGMVRREGPRDWTGSFVAGGAIPQVGPGDTFEFVGFVGPASAYTPGATGPVYRGTAIVSQVAININWSTGAIVGYTVSFEANGELAQETGSYSDLSVPDAPSSSAASVMIVTGDGSGSGSETETEWCNLESLTLTLSAANVSLVNSCSGAWTLRRPGNIDWTMSVVAHEADFSNFPFDQGDYVHFRIYVDDTRYWDLKWGIIKDYGNMTVDRESAAIISVTVAVEMSSHTNDPADGIGHVRLPGHPDEDWWPKGELGLEQLLNASFDDGATYWTETPTDEGATFGTGEVTLGSEQAIYQQVWLEAGKTYLVAVAADSVSGAELQVRVGTVADSSSVLLALSTGGTDEDDFEPASTGWHYVEIRTTITVSADVQSVSVKPYN